MIVLITGGAGFIGSHLVNALQEKAEVRVVDNFRSGSLRNLAGLQHRLFEGSILDRELVRSACEGVDYVFHLAALVSVPESMERKTECLEINARGSLIVLEEAARAGVRKLCFSSSAAIYGNNPVTPKVETMLPEPRSPYAITKLDGEYYCALFAAESLLPTACLRYFNVFGPRQDPQSQYAAAIPGFVSRALRGMPLTIFGDGSQTRDFIYIEDVVAANLHLATDSPATGVFNVGCGQSRSILELAKSIVEVTGRGSPIQFGPERPGDVRHSCADVSRLAATGFRPKWTLREGLESTIQAFRRSHESAGS